MHRSIHLSNCVLIRCMNNTAIHVHFAHKLIMLIFIDVCNRLNELLILSLLLILIFPIDVHFI